MYIPGVVEVDSPEKECGIRHSHSPHHGMAKVPANLHTEGGKQKRKLCIALALLFDFWHSCLPGGSSGCAEPVRVRLTYRLTM